jgi:hypothetical protein
MRYLTAFFSAMFLLQPFMAFGQTTGSANRVAYEQAMYDYFGRSPFYAIPIFLAGSRASGDTLRVGTYDKYAPREHCFSKLGPPQLAKSALTKEMQIDDQTISGSGRIDGKRVLEAAVGAKFARVRGYSLSFTNVEVDETPEHYLVQYADYAKCGFLKDIFSKKPKDADKVLTNFVVHGTREISISLEKTVGGSGDVSAFSGLLSKFIGGGKVEAKYDDKLQSLFTIPGQVQVPIAFRPIFVSLPDVLKRETQIKNGWDKELDEIWKARDREHARARLGQMELLVPPKQIIATMFSGELTSFNPREVERDRSYINFVTLHILAASIAYGEI